MSKKGEHMLINMAETAPRMAVRVAWKRIEAELAAYAKPIPKQDVPHWPIRLASVLVHEGKLSAADAEAIERMLGMRNATSHGKFPMPSTNEAKQYIQMALTLAERIKSAVDEVVESESTESTST